MTIYLKGFLLGMTLQLSVGPVFFALLHKSIKEGFIEGLKMTLGVALVDAAYIALSFTAVSGILAASGNLAWILRLVGALVLCYFGLGYFRRAGKQSFNAEDSGTGKSFYYGLKLTMINPLSIVFWTGTFGAVVASGMVPVGNGMLLYAGGCVSATLLFLTGASFLGSRVQGFLTPRVMKNLDRTVGTCLFLFAISLLIQ
jgi:threonine/homoserine/homoserine lactone efflux protein